MASPASDSAQRIERSPDLRRTRRQLDDTSIRGLPLVALAPIEVKARIARLTHERDGIDNEIATAKATQASNATLPESFKQLDAAQFLTPYPSLPECP